jgi:hypothetical protein
MPVTTGNIGLIPAASGSELTSSFDVLNVFFSSPTYGSINPSASIASIKVNIIEFNDSGSAGELVFHTNSPENSGSVGEPVLTLFATGSNNEPRVGVGFSGSEKPIKAFEIKTKTDSAEGSEFLMRSSRSTEGAQIGDLGGAIRFSIDSASFKDITTSGSVALIDSIVTTVEPEGVTGDLAFNVATSARLAPTEMVRLRGDSNKVTITGSVEVSGEITTNTIGRLYEIASSNSYEIESIPISDYSGVIYDYYIKGQTSNVNDARTGQFFVAANNDNSQVIFTDTSTISTNGSSSVEFSASLDGSNIKTWLLNGNNYKIRAFTKKFTD